jgi:hypothetical protein
LTHKWITLLVLATLLAVDLPATAAELVLTEKFQHLRSGAVREWADFPEQAEAAELRVTFQSSTNATEQTLRLRQRDIKQTWVVRINDREIARLPPDENDMVTFWPVPANTLKEGANTLVIASDGKPSDDVNIGDVRLDDRPRDKVLNAAQIQVSVTDDNDRALPCRLTVVDSNGSLMTVGAASREGLAVRPGVIYTSDGRAAFGLPVGRYTLYAGRGFEYDVASSQIAVQPGETAVRQLKIRREVPTEGYVACDTHCHTLTFSGHGDATLAERMVTIAGEGIELPIACDHNQHVDYESAAIAAGVRSYFTPVIGNEVTTPRMGHFNIFPIAGGAKVVDQAAAGWTELFREIKDCPDVTVTVLNHPRDVHGGYRPFGPEHHLSLVGENLDGWKLEANAMEVVNSGALQSDVMRVYRDWFGLLNRGFRIAPVGASDSHDTARYFVGQGRTYIRCASQPGRIDVREACQNLADGRVLVSLGLLCEMTVSVRNGSDRNGAGRHGPGDLVPAADELDVAVRVLGPSWSKATHVALFANGIKMREAEIGEVRAGAGERVNETGVKWKGSWRLPRFKHDVHLAAIALGPGVKELFWPIARPYQPSSPVWNSYVVGSTGAIWIDADESGGFNPAFEYATRLVDAAQNDLARLVSRLADYDAAVAAQAARLWHVRKLNTPAELLNAASRTEIMSIRDGFQAYVEEWKESETARAASK